VEVLGDGQTVSLAPTRNGAHREPKRSRIPKSNFSTGERFGFVDGMAFSGLSGLSEAARIKTSVVELCFQDHCFKGW
jgi:hypothetical protein